jgi:hypothetical protein
VITTPELIDRLSTSPAPVRRLRPLLRAGQWLLLAGLVVALLAVLQGVRPDLAPHLREPVFAAALAGSLLTGILAAVAAFYLCLPDRSRLWALLPAPAVVLWVATIGYGCLTDWVRVTPGGLRLGSTLECFATLVAVTVPSAAALFAMLRGSARLDPTMVGLMGGLAVAGMAATALSLLHDLDATVMVLLWNLGAAALIVVLGGTLGRRNLRGPASPIGV